MLGVEATFSFFVLSAFLLTYRSLTQYWIFRHERQMSAHVRFWLKYTLLRFFRIYPLYFVAHVMFLFNRRSPDFELSFLVNPEFLESLFLIEARWWLWSIPVECRYYALIPILVMCYTFVRHQIQKNFRHPRVLWTWVHFFVWVRLYRYSLDYYYAPMYDENYVTVHHLPVFFTGSILGMLYFELHVGGTLGKLHAWLESSDHWTGRFVRDSLDLSCYACALWILSSLPPQNLWLHGQGRTKIDSAREQNLLLLLGLLSRGSFTRVFENSWLQTAGKYSFGIYVVHPFMMDWAFHNISWPSLPHDSGLTVHDLGLVKVMVMAGSISLFVYLSSRFFEDPIMRAVREATKGWNEPKDRSVKLLSS